MNRADKMLSVLRDGKSHSRRDLFDRIGFFLTNNAASELRAQGHDVRQHRKNVDGVTVYSYQWFGSLPEGDRPVGQRRAASPSESELGSLNDGDAGEGKPLGALASVEAAGGAASTSPSLSEPEQPVLFEEPRKPAWA